MKTLSTFKIFFILIFLLSLNIPMVFSDVKVNGYHRKDGTYVKPHYRSDRDGLKNNNWTTQGNVNPYTGEKGSLKRDRFEAVEQVYPIPVAESNQIEQEDGCSNHNDYVCPRNASNYLNMVIEVCGYVANVREFSKGFYLNFDKSFPNETLNGVVWADKVQDFIDGTGLELKAVKGEFICMNGKVSLFNNRYQIVGYDSFRIL